MQKMLDVKLARIAGDRSVRDFILADAKDADMAFGLAAPGLPISSNAADAVAFKTLDQYREQIREVIAQGLVDIVLMSASTCEMLAIEEGLFDHSPVTPAVRANDTTDIWLAGAEGCYGTEASRPFRTASLEHAMYGRALREPDEGLRGADLGLYSITFNNILDRDYEALEAYGRFRGEAESRGFRHFLEVFSPNAPGPQRPSDIPRFVNNQIVRTLAGITQSQRPLFLKIPYYGPRAMEELVRYDSRIVVGILGGGSGTTLDAFGMLWEAKRYGARVALYGRKINNAEHQPSFIALLRLIADDQILPVEAVRAYHAVLEKLHIRPFRPLEQDLLRTDSGEKSYGGESISKISVRIPETIGTPVKAAAPSAGKPDFSAMSPAEKVAWNLERIRKY